ncbi:xyloglucan endotransglucosylase/hydrolase protein 2-like [Wolffia australiana]
MAKTVAWILLGLMVAVTCVLGQKDPVFGENYVVVWGADHVCFVEGGKEIQLLMDKSSGSRFDSKVAYTSGFFRMRIKLPGGDSAGVVTAFYLSSDGEGHDELDFEFLGNREGKPYTLQTNVFAGGVGNREQRIHLWFDPTVDFHDYKILWNPSQIVFFVDDMPLRVFKNKEKSGVRYPSKAMKIIGSIWNGENWATDGGKEKIDWSEAPFRAGFRGFAVDGCAEGWKCSEAKAYWNSPRFSRLSTEQERRYANVKAKYMTYDYCSDRRRYSKTPPECPQ